MTPTLTPSPITPSRIISAIGEWFYSFKHSDKRSETLENGIGTFTLWLIIGIVIFVINATLTPIHDSIIPRGTGLLLGIAEALALSLCWQYVWDSFTVASINPRLRWVVPLLFLITSMVGLFSAHMYVLKDYRAESITYETNVEKATTICLEKSKAFAAAQIGAGNIFYMPALRNTVHTFATLNGHYNKDVVHACLSQITGRTETSYQPPSD